VPPEPPLYSPISVGKDKPEASHPPQIVADLEKISGIGPVYLDRLNKAGVSDSISLAALQPDALKQILGARVSLATARDFISQAKALSRVNSS
jgi:predicted flap endonuclease-1-like 5' DNA nuclease